LTTRFVVCIDIEEDDVAKAYTELYRFMHNQVPAHKIGWESTDEVFGEDGELMNQNDIQEAREKGFAQIKDMFNEREGSLLVLRDEDLEKIGIDASSISDDKFDEITEAYADEIEDTFDFGELLRFTIEEHGLLK
jgi:hypothetical protein